jgi:hypothetical protein
VSGAGDEKRNVPIEKAGESLDSRVRGNDDMKHLLTPIIIL